MDLPNIQSRDNYIETHRNYTGAESSSAWSTVPEVVNKLNGNEFSAFARVVSRSNLRTGRTEEIWQGTLTAPRNIYIAPTNGLNVPVLNFLDKAPVQAIVISDRGDNGYQVIYNADISNCVVDTNTNPPELLGTVIGNVLPSVETYYASLDSIIESINDGTMLRQLTSNLGNEKEAKAIIDNINDTLISRKYVIPIRVKNNERLARSQRLYNENANGPLFSLREQESLWRMLQEKAKAYSNKNDILRSSMVAFGWDLIDHTNTGSHSAQEKFNIIMDVWTDSQALRTTHATENNRVLLEEERYDNHVLEILTTINPTATANIMNQQAEQATKDKAEQIIRTMEDKLSGATNLGEENDALQEAERALAALEEENRRNGINPTNTTSDAREKLNAWKELFRIYEDARNKATTAQNNDAFDQAIRDGKTGIDGVVTGGKTPPKYPSNSIISRKAEDLKGRLDTLRFVEPRRATPPPKSPEQIEAEAVERNYKTLLNNDRIYRYTVRLTNLSRNANDDTDKKLANDKLNQLYEIMDAQDNGTLNTFTSKYISDLDKEIMDFIEKYGFLETAQ